MHRSPPGGLLGNLPAQTPNVSRADRLTLGLSDSTSRVSLELQSDTRCDPVKGDMGSIEPFALLAVDGCLGGRSDRVGNLLLVLCRGRRTIRIALSDVNGLMHVNDAHMHSAVALAMSRLFLRQIGRGGPCCTPVGQGREDWPPIMHRRSKRTTPAFKTQEA